MKIAVVLCVLSIVGFASSQLGRICRFDVDCRPNQCCLIQGTFMASRQRQLQGYRPVNPFAQFGRCANRPGAGETCFVFDGCPCYDGLICDGSIDIGTCQVDPNA